jgi:hypothetical protein
MRSREVFRANQMPRPIDPTADIAGGTVRGDVASGTSSQRTVVLGDHRALPCLRLKIVEVNQTPQRNWAPFFLGRTRIVRPGWIIDTNAAHDLGEVGAGP